MAQEDGAEVGAPVVYYSYEEPPAPRGRRFWLRSYALAILVVLVTLGGFTALGAYQGMNDRRVQNKVEAIEAFERGRVLMDEGKYELAVAYFREALRLEPNFEAAAQFMEVAERDAAVVAGREATALPPTETALDTDALFAEAMTALQGGDWERAAATFDTLVAQAPTYRPAEVEAGLFEAQMKLARASLDAEDLEGALRHIDQALAVRPDDAAAQKLRRQTAAYHAGLLAYSEGEWQSASDQLRAVYLLDPNFLATTALLADAHFKMGQEFEQREIWCEAAQQYRASVSVKRNVEIDALAQTSDRRCQTRAAIPPTATRAGTRTPPRGTPVGTGTPSVGVNATEEISATATPAASATLAPPRPTVPATRSAFAYTLVGGVGENFDDSCGGHYIRGSVSGPDGTPLANVAILVVDQYGNRMTATTKSDPLGQYDFPISAQPLSYQIMVLEGGAAASASITVEHSERFAQSAQACHILNWRQSP